MNRKRIDQYCEMKVRRFELDKVISISTNTLIGPTHVLYLMSRMVIAEIELPDEI